MTLTSESVLCGRAVIRQNWSKFRQICKSPTKNSDNNDVFSSKFRQSGQIFPRNPASPTEISKFAAPLPLGDFTDNSII